MTPTAPTPTPVATETRYNVQFVASALCPNAGQGSMFRRTFDFQMVGEESFGSLLFRLPAPWNQMPNTGDLTLRLALTGDQIAGTLGGYGLSDDAVHTFASWESGSRTGVARVTGRSLPDSTLEGTFAGYVTFSVFRLSAGGECTASDHRWRAVLRQ